MRAVVFAYHNVGVRCIKVLRARGLDVVLVVTHEDNSSESIWFDSVASLCREEEIPFTVDTPDNPALLARVRDARPDFIFSFYYRQLLPMQLLSLAQEGAYNMHGSLLPKYRGRAPVNWAVLHGETETGATLHQMTEKPDAGAIVAQSAVPILPDDTAFDVFGKVVVAAEQALWQVLPAMLAGKTPKRENDLSRGSYFGARTPEDGRIDWSQSAQDVYNLHRAVAPPYPGAWTVIGERVVVLGKARLWEKLKTPMPPGLAISEGNIVGVCGDGRALLIHQLLEKGTPLTAVKLKEALSSSLC